jgi:hypothetical protein
MLCTGPLFVTWKRGSKQGKTSDAKYDCNTQELTWSDGEIIDFQTALTQDITTKQFESKNLAISLVQVRTQSTDRPTGRLAQ